MYYLMMLNTNKMDFEQQSIYKCIIYLSVLGKNHNTVSKWCRPKVQTKIVANQVNLWLSHYAPSLTNNFVDQSARQQTKPTKRNGKCEVTSLSLIKGLANRSL